MTPSFVAPCRFCELVSSLLQQAKDSTDLERQTEGILEVCSSPSISDVEYDLFLVSQKKKIMLCHK